MNTLVLIVLEIIKYSVPALIVFLTVYFILKKYMDNQLQLMAMQNRSKRTDQLVVSKLQAYERLMMFCERIAVPNLIYRLKTNQSNARMLENSLLIGIQQEFDHNLSQQIYVSEQLWKIIQLSKDQLINYIMEQGSMLGEKASGEDLSRQLLNNLPSGDKDPVAKAKQAIRTETSILFS
jgi:hypothetical protein